MTPIRLLSSNVMARVAALLVLAAPTTASAQGLIDFLWGGSSDWGGGRQNVSFSPRYTPGQIIVSFGDRRLYHITGRGRATSYPIAVPRDAEDAELERLRLQLEETLNRLTAEARQRCGQPQIEPGRPGLSADGDEPGHARP